MLNFISGFADAHPMAVLTGAVGALSAFYHDRQISVIHISVVRHIVLLHSNNCSACL